MTQNNLERKDTAFAHWSLKGGH